MVMARVRSTPGTPPGYSGGGYNMSYAQPNGGGGLAGGLSVSGNASGGPQMGLTLTVAMVVLVSAYLWTRKVQGARG